MVNKFCATCGEEKPLTKFHRRAASRDGRKSQCKVCVNRKQKERRERPEVKKAKQQYNKEYYSRPEKIIAKKEYMKEYMIEYMKEYCTRPGIKAARKEYQKKYHVRTDVILARSARKGAIRASSKKYYTSPKGRESHRRNRCRYRARKKGATTGFVDEPAIYAFCNNQCIFCGEVEDLTVDHIIAIDVGGPHCQNNLLVACRSCNSSKHTKNVEVWIKTRPESDQQRYKAYKKRKEEWRAARCFMWI